MISVNNLSIHFTGNDLFSNVSFLVNDKERLGLVGKNGAGKTTLLRILAGEQSAQTGEIVIPTGQAIGYLPQDRVSSSKKSVYNEAKLAFDHLLKLEEEQQRISNEIAQREDYESEDYLKCCEKLNELEENYRLYGGHSMEGDLEKVLLGLGFSREDFSKPISTFSNGWQMRVELAKLLLSQPEILLLDEPTNHLDIESIQWFEGVLQNYNGAVILVSHDRAFLDAVTKRTIEISMGKIFDYKANYSGYVEMREERMSTQKAALSNQQQEIAQIEQFIERFRYKSTKSKQVQSRVKLLEKMDKVEVDESDNSHIHFRFPPAPHCGKIVAEAENLGKKYGEKEVLKELEHIIVKGDKIAFVGRNGEGKTTLARMLVGELDYSGILKIGSTVKIGYYAQNPELLLENEKTVFQTIDDVAVGDMRGQIKNLLGGFLFSGEDLDKKVKVLSGGEKSRLALAKLLLFPVNLLILDEPTNHLDMRSKDILKSALLRFDGTLIIVSHDRDFLQGLTNRLFEFRNKTVRQHIGDINAFLEFRRLENLKQLEEVRKKSDSNEKSVSQNKLNYEMRKQKDREKRKIQNRITKCEEEMMRVEEIIAECDNKLSNPNDFQEEISSNSFHTEYGNYKKELDSITENWEELHDKLEELSLES